MFAHLEEEGVQNGQNHKQPESGRKQLRAEGLEPQDPEIRANGMTQWVKPVGLNSISRSHTAEKENPGPRDQWSLEVEF